MPTKGFPQEFQGSFAVPGLGDVAFGHFTLMVDRAPKVMLHAIDFDENLVEMPTPVPEGAHGRGPIPANPSAENLPEAVPPEANRLMGDVDAALVEQILDVAQGKRVPDIQHNGQTDNLRRRFEVSEEVRRGHRLRLSTVSTNGTDLRL